MTPYDFTSAWVHRLANEMQQWEETLIREEAQDLLTRVGISAKLRAVQSHDGSVPLSSIPGLDAPALGASLKSFYAALFSLSLPAFDRLTSPRIRVRARRGTSQLIAAGYTVRSPAWCCCCSLLILLGPVPSDTVRSDCGPSERVRHRVRARAPQPRASVRAAGFGAVTSALFTLAFLKKNHCCYNTRCPMT